MCLVRCVVLRKSTSLALHIIWHLLTLAIPDWDTLCTIFASPRHYYKTYQNFEQEHDANLKLVWLDYCEGGQDCLRTQHFQCGVLKLTDLSIDFSPHFIPPPVSVPHPIELIVWVNGTEFWICITDQLPSVCVSGKPEAAASGGGEEKIFPASLVAPRLRCGEEIRNISPRLINSGLKFFGDISLRI